MSRLPSVDDSSVPVSFPTLTAAEGERDAEDRRLGLPVPAALATVSTD